MLSGTATRQWNVISGAGTSRLARRLPTILPAMTLPEALDTTRIQSVARSIGGAWVL